MAENFFKDYIKPEMEKIKEEEGITQDGIAFQYWIAKLLCEYNHEIDKSDRRILISKDGGVDVILFSPNQELMYLIQAKYTGKSKAVKREDILGFDKLRDSINYDWLDRQKDLAENAKEALHEYLYNKENNWQIEWKFITNGKIPDGLRDNEKLECEIYGTTELKEIYKQSKSQIEPIPESITFDVSNKKFIELDTPRKTLIAIVKGNQIKDLYGKHKESLLAFNVRKFMGDKGINKEIKETANEKGDDFFYFNNGISAICNRFTKEGNSVKAEKFQIINGGQTIGSLYKAKRSENLDKVRVLLKLTEGVGLATEKGFNYDIIRYNNTQNVIKASDFRANDKIQEDIKNKFSSLKISNSALEKKIEYRPKRGGSNVKPGSQNLTLEELAKIRYAYKYNPCDVVEKTKLLWDIQGHYKKAFGDENAIWTEEDFNEAVLAVAFFNYINDKIDSLKKKAKNSDDSGKYNYLARLKYHILGLAGVYINNKKENLIIWKSKNNFEVIFKDFWPLQLIQTTRMKEDADNIKTTRGGLNNIRRSKDRWDRLRDDFKTYLEGL